MKLTEAHAKHICDSYVNAKNMMYLNFTNCGDSLRPVLVRDIDNNIFLYDSYMNMSTRIRDDIDQDLTNNNGYTDDFYLSLEQIDMLDLNKHVYVRENNLDVIEGARKIVDES